MPLRVRMLDMITSKEWQEFEKDEMAKEKMDIDQKFRILDALYEEAVYLGVFPLKDPLDGIDVDVNIAKVVNNVPRAA